MSARSIRIPTILIAIVATMSLALPAVATAEVSAVDAISADAATDGFVNSSSARTEYGASDSPTVSTYGGGETEVPPPVDCDSPTTDSSSSSSDTSSSSDSSSSTETLSCTPVTECAAGDSDGKDQHGKPCVECSSVDTDGTDASGQACVKTETVVTETPCTDAGITGGGSPVTTVCGGGGVEEAPIEEPLVAEPTEGGGAPAPIPAEVLGGGGPELPFTGLPLFYAIYGGLGLMLLGGALWMRGHFGKQG